MHPLLQFRSCGLISFILVVFLVKKPKAEEKADKKNIGQFITGIKEILHEKSRWLYAIFAIGGICMFVTFGVLFYLSETLEAKYKLLGASKGFVLAIPLALLCLASYGSGKNIGKKQVINEMARLRWNGSDHGSNVHHRL